MAGTEETSQDPPGQPRRVLAILGMHRSGTSLAAIISQELGAVMGQELMPPNDFNRDGYAEDVQIVRLHDQLLADFQRPWNTRRGTLPMPEGWTEGPEFSRTRDSLAAYLESEFARVGDQIWAIKDPRLSVLLPLWLRLEKDLDFRLIPVLCVRAPNAVAASLERRDTMPVEIGRLLWLHYNAQIVRTIGKRVRAVLSYDAWFSDPDRNLSALAAAMARSPTADLREKILKQKIDADLRHHTSASSPSLFSRWQLLLDKWAAEQELPADLAEEARTFCEFSEVFDQWRSAVIDDNAASKVIDALRRERDQVVVTADENLKAYRTLEEERHRLLTAATDNLKAYQTIDVAFHNARDEVTRLDHELRAAMEEVSRLDNELRTRAEFIAELERKLEDQDKVIRGLIAFGPHYR